MFFDMYILKVFSVPYELRHSCHGPNKRYKKKLFLSRAQTHHSFTFNSQFLPELKHKVHLSKSVFEIFHFRFRFVFIKVWFFVQEKASTLWLEKVIIPFKIEIIGKPHTLLLPDLASMFKLQQKMTWRRIF